MAARVPGATFFFPSLAPDLRRACPISSSRASTARRRSTRSSGRSTSRARSQRDRDGPRPSRVPFTGARGVGKTTRARILAKASTARTRPTADAVQRVRRVQGDHRRHRVDVQEIDGATNNGVDAIRELREAIRYRAGARQEEGLHHRRSPHALDGAFNALLKTLEEPPPHVMFIFATTEPHKLPDTILSRCQRYDFKLVPAARASSSTSPRSSTTRSSRTSPAALSLVARESGGSVRDALSLLDQVIASSPARAHRGATSPRCSASPIARCSTSWAARSRARTRDAALALVDAAFARGQDLAQLAHAFLGHLRDLGGRARGRRSGALVDASAAGARGAGQGGAVGAGGRARALLRPLRQDHRGGRRSRRCRATCSRSG